jgi:predicted  nucleic acid-binding Zn-ribbon protein
MHWAFDNRWINAALEEVDKIMSTKELYKQKLQAQVDGWKADIAKLKAKAAGEAADAQITMHKQFEAFEHKVDEAQAKLGELAEASEEAWDSVKHGVEAAWGSLKSAAGDAVSKFKN